MQVQAIINSVSPRAAGSGTIYDVDLGGQVYSTFDAEMMRLANDHLGQTVIAEVDVKPSKDGRFTNYFFNGIPGAAPAGPPALGPVAAPPAGQMAPATPAPMPQLMGPPAPTAAETDARITKLSLLKSAAELVGRIYEGAGPESLVEAEDAATTLAKVWFKTVMAPAAPAPLQAVPEPVSQNEVPVSSEIPDW